MDAQKYLESHWKTGGIAHSQMIQFLEEYADIKLAEFKAKNLPQSVVIGSILTGKEIKAALERGLKSADMDIPEAAKEYWMGGAKWMRNLIRSMQ